LLKRIRLELALAWDLARSFFEPVMAYRLGHLVIVKRRYRRPWHTVLSDGTVLERGDHLVRLHMKLFLPRMRGGYTETAYARYLYELLAPELPKLAALLRQDPEWAKYRALTGQSHIVGRFTERAGLETHPIPDFWKVMVDIMGRGAMLLSDPSPRCLLKVTRPGNVRPPRECWASREQFLCFYPDTGEQVPELRRLFKIFGLEF
jgi:hypothetical protein